MDLNTKPKKRAPMLASLLFLILAQPAASDAVASYQATIEFRATARVQGEAIGFTNGWIQGIVCSNRHNECTEPQTYTLALKEKGRRPEWSATGLSGTLSYHYMSGGGFSALPEEEALEPNVHESFTYIDLLLPRSTAKELFTQISFFPGKLFNSLLGTWESGEKPLHLVAYVGFSYLHGNSGELNPRTVLTIGDPASRIEVEFDFSPQPKTYSPK